MILGKGSAVSEPWLNLKSRSVTGVALVALITGVLWLAPTAVFAFGVAVFSVLGLFELLTMLKLRGVQVYRVFGVSIGSILPLVVYTQMGLTESGDVLFVVLSCFCLFIIQFARSENPRALEGIALTFFSMMYVGWFLSFLVKIKFLYLGWVWIAYLLTVTKVSDVAAFVVGSLWGKHNLIPHISPRKTTEGTVAGLAASALVSVMFAGRLPLAWSALQLALVGTVMGLVAQCGDLSESLIKRYCGVKDSGARLPGFGGVLDIIDSVLFTAPLFYFYLKTQMF